ncbi:aldehyde dehydrogenase family protein [Streptomyces sp. MnatMP-M17]|uniref:aldehyde dehydrogenase family protein n=1 Tax=unclassified Streptomyces TaxID=2593676 RepID=UPI00081EB63D|nr:aldehyde dehydrogenase family protein [Streptomyces sp. MnatMP-M17]MYZ34440.1 aldehyde dehydrogenase family protein [Streptomyces sp. SID4917]SCF67396.1 aldehyde dehydrogenase (NAD+) [Streptomyces sp. MnatMP-M17]
MIKNFEMYVDGAWRSSASGEVIESINPYTREAWATVPAGTADDVDAAVSAAVRASADPGWSRNPKVRAKLLTRLADALAVQADAIAEIESRDNGKVINEELAMNRAVPGWYRYAAAVAETAAGQVPYGNDPAVLSLTEREPYGVVGIQTPWNTPGVLLAQMASMALAAGNTIVVKPSELAPCSLLEFARVVHEVGFPAGVINVVTGLGPIVGQALCEHPGVDKLTLTGGPEAGRIVAAQAARRLVPAVMELGGKSANLVFPDADVEQAAAAVAAGFTSAGGQSCVAGTRVLVHRSIHDEVVKRIVKQLADLRLGDPSQPDTDMGPLCTSDQVQRVQSFVDRGLADGATLRTGGRTRAEEGTFFFPPVVFTDVTPEMAIFSEEIFGPVLSVVPFDTEEEAIRLNNATPYGLAAGVWTRDLNRAHRVSRALKAGTVWVNHYRRGDAAFPFGGYGHSGYGRVNGIDGYREMSRTKSIQILLGAAES